jgi:ribosome biogenesis protein ERB1
MPHIGYDIDGKKVFRPAHGDELDKFLSTVDDPTSWWAHPSFLLEYIIEFILGRRPLTKTLRRILSYPLRSLTLSGGCRRVRTRMLTMILTNPQWSGSLVRVKKRLCLCLLHLNPNVDGGLASGRSRRLANLLTSLDVVILTNFALQVMKIVRAIRQGRIIPAKPTTASSKPQFYAIWNEPSSSTLPAPLPAPKVRLPTHAESYNPPEEYVPTEEERKEWENTDPADRERDFLPRKYGSLRLVPGYDHFVQERFSRQLDLYLAPRVQRARLNIDPESLVPKLPSPASLRPFPAYRALEVHHEKGRVRALAVSSDGAWAVSADEGGVVSLWEVLVGREVKRWIFEGKVGAVVWCPRTDVSFFVVGIEDTLHFLLPPHLPPLVLKATQTLLAPAELPPAPATPSPVKWTSTSATTHAIDKPILTIKLPEASGVPRQLTWHRRGDYVASVCKRYRFSSVTICS